MQLETTLSPKIAFGTALDAVFAARALKLPPAEIRAARVTFRSIDARRKPILVNVRLEIEKAGDPVSPAFAPKRLDVSKAAPILIIGSGPAGLFAALKLLELGRKPVILERGAEVDARKRDIATLCRDRVLNPESNYCFGEGGAGTFSDGKLFTRSKKRGDNERILQLFREHGAPESILYDVHPHIGSDNLPSVIAAMRKTLLDHGAEIHFNARVTDLIVKDGRVLGATTADGKEFLAPATLLATGHSARDVYEILQKRGVRLVPKGFAMGIRIEHPQALINRIQYHRDPAAISYLPPANYFVVTQAADRGVYSFCMCPGGFIVPAASGPEAVVVNGMSPARHNSPFANSGLVVEIRPEDFPVQAADGTGGILYQKTLELNAFIQANRTQQAPAQRLADFAAGHSSKDLPASSYIPGLTLSDLHAWLPEALRKRLQSALKTFDKNLHGFLTNEAIAVGVESRTSSPVRVPRDRDTYEQLQLKGLYPCGEGAGYAGGILSSAVDGENAAQAAAARL